MAVTEAFKIFCEQEFDDVTAERRQRLAGEISAEDQDYILGVDRDRYVEHLVSKYAFDPLILELDEKTVSDGEIEVLAEQFPPGFAVQRGGRYKRPIVRYHIPFSGDSQLLRCRPNPFYVDRAMFVAEGCLCFDIVVFYQNEPERVRNAADRTLKMVKQQYDSLSEQVNLFNRSLRAVASTAIARGIGEIEQRTAFVAALGVPVRRREAPTLPVPVARKRLVIDRPEPAKAVSDPALAQEMYEEILRLLHRLGRTFERLPSLYAGKDEEALRDHLIPYLESHFELASTTGETFNKSGKTDILMRYEGVNVFVAECKFWGGQKKHLETIDQALSYLSWRDSKAAIICFVKNKAMTATLRSVEGDTLSHSQFARFLGKREETWFDYEFSLPQDTDRHIRLAVLCFHTPE